MKPLGVDTSFEGEKKERNGIFVVLERCTVCMLCMVACAVEHTGSLNPSKARIRVESRLPLVKVEFSEECDLCRSLGVSVPFCVQKCPKGALRVRVKE